METVLSRAQGRGWRCGVRGYLERGPVGLMPKGSSRQWGEAEKPRRQGRMSAGAPQPCWLLSTEEGGETG